VRGTAPENDGRNDRVATAVLELGVAIETSLQSTHRPPVIGRID
jgi:hypothetical protein